MKILNPEPEDMITILTRHLARQPSPPLTLTEKRIKQLLRGDNGTLAGTLLHLCALIIQCRQLEHLKYGSASRMGIEISFRQRNKALHLIIKNAILYPGRMATDVVNNRGKKINIVLHACKSQ